MQEAWGPKLILAEISSKHGEEHLCWILLVLLNYASEIMMLYFILISYLA